MIGKVNVSGGNGIRGLKIYQQTDEPKPKQDSIWVETDEKIKKVCLTDVDTDGFKFIPFPSNSDVNYFISIDDDIYTIIKNNTFAKYDIKDYTSTDIAIFEGTTRNNFFHYNGSIYFLGIQNNRYNVYEYNLVTQSRTLVDDSTPLLNYASDNNIIEFSAIVKSDIYLFKRNKNVVKFNILTKEFTLIEDILPNEDNFGAFNNSMQPTVINDDIYFWTGTTRNNYGYKFNTLTNSITILSNPPDLGLQITNAFAYNGLIYALSNRNVSGTYNINLLKYNPKLDTYEYEFKTTDSKKLKYQSVAAISTYYPVYIFLIIINDYIYFNLGQNYKLILKYLLRDDDTLYIHQSGTTKGKKLITSNITDNINWIENKGGVTTYADYAE